MKTKMQVKKTTHETVRPAAPSPGGLLPLSIMDLLVPPIYTSRLFFFSQESLPDCLTALLKTSLAETLTFFYPCAGRFRETSHGELQIDCNDEGALFFEAWVDRQFDDFLPHFDPNPDFTLLVPKPDASEAISHLPLLIVQVTHFECGHISLGMGLHHFVCDGFSSLHLLNTWATLAKSKTETDLHGEGTTATQPILPPYIDRSLLKACEVPSPTSDHPEFRTDTPNVLPPQPPCSCKFFSFTPSSIDALRAKASTNITPSHSRFEAVAAHLWRGITYARNLAPDQDIRLGIAVDGRKRFNPPLPEGYFGNVVFYGYTACTAGEVVGKPLAFAADQVKAAIGKVTDEHMRSTLDWVAKQESRNTVSASFFTPGLDLGITSWWRFPLYDLDFGWGKPLFVRTASYASDGMLVLFPSPMGPGHVDALVSLAEGHMLKFEEYINDPL